MVSFWRRVVLVVVCVFVIAAVRLVATPSVAAASPGSQGPEPDLGAILLAGRDVPPGFELDAKQSGSYEKPPTAPSWLSPIMQHAAHLRGYDRVWFNRQEHRAIIAQVVEYPIDKLASADANSAAQDFKNEAVNEFTITTVPYARGFVVKYGKDVAAQGLFVRGPRAFSIAVLTRTTASEADIELTRRLVEIQAAKAPPGPTGLRDISKPSLAAGTALGTLGAGVAYIGSLSLVAWFRDPLRRHPIRPGPQQTALPNTTTVDVTARARRRRRRAAAGLLLELSGAGMTVAGLLPFTWPLGLLLAALGVGIAWIPRLVTATARRAGSGSELWTGRHRLRVACFTAISTVCVLTGLLAMVLYGVGAVLTSPGYDYNVRIVFVGVALSAARHSLTPPRTPPGRSRRRRGAQARLTADGAVPPNIRRRLARHPNGHLCTPLVHRPAQPAPVRTLRGGAGQEPHHARTRRRPQPTRYRPRTDWGSTGDAACRALAVNHYQVDDRRPAHCCGGRTRGHYTRIWMGAALGRLSRAVVEDPACSAAGARRRDADTMGTVHKDVDRHSHGPPPHPLRPGTHAGASRLPGCRVVRRHSRSTDRVDLHRGTCGRHHNGKLNAHRARQDGTGHPASTTRWVISLASPTEQVGDALRRHPWLMDRPRSRFAATPVVILCTKATTNHPTARFC
jgi:hypothetical protein